MAQRIGFSLVAIGALVLIGWSVRGFFLASDIPLIVRIAVGAIGLGFLILIGTVIKDRISQAKEEDFKEVRT